MRWFLAFVLSALVVRAIPVLPSHATGNADLSHMALRLNDLPKSFVLTSTLDLKNQPGGAEEYIAGFTPKSSGGNNSCMGMMCGTSHPGAGLTEVESDLTRYSSAMAAQHAMPAHAALPKLKITPVGQRYSVQYSRDTAGGTATIVLLFCEGRIVAAIQVTGYSDATRGSATYLALDVNHFAAIVDGRIKQAGAR